MKSINSQVSWLPVKFIKNEKLQFEKIFDLAKTSVFIVRKSMDKSG